MLETQTVIRVERELWKHFKAECLLRDTHFTAMVTQLIQQQVTAWEEERYRAALHQRNLRIIQKG